MEERGSNILNSGRRGEGPGGKEHRSKRVDVMGWQALHFTGQRSRGQPDPLRRDPVFPQVHMGSEFRADRTLFEVRE